MPVANQQDFGRYCLGAQQGKGVQQIAVGFFRAHGGAQADDGVIGRKSETGTQCPALLSRLPIGEIVDVNAIVNHGIGSRAQAAITPVVALIFTNIQQQVAALEQALIQQHLRLFLVGSQQGGVKYRGQLGFFGTALPPRQVAVEHGIRIRADNGVNVTRADQRPELADCAPLDTANHLAADELIEPAGVELRQEALTALQIGKMQPEALRVEMVEQGHHLFLGAAELQRVDYEQ
jgi:hypothetical protein